MLLRSKCLFSTYRKLQLLRPRNRPQNSSDGYNAHSGSMPSQTTLLKDKVLKLQAILELENGRPYSYEEAERIGRGLLNYYSNLADNELGIGLIVKPIEEYENNLIYKGNEDEQNNQ